jgi:hypothetical protein
MNAGPRVSLVELGLTVKAVLAAGTSCPFVSGYGVSDYRLADNFSIDSPIMTE